MTARWLMAGVLACSSIGCYRTVYRNLQPSEPTVEQGHGTRRSSAWRSFFLYGWVPSEVLVHAAAECGGAANVREIRTRRTFNQAMVAAFASSGGVNVYSPWTGEVVCEESAGPKTPLPGAGRDEQPGNFDERALGIAGQHGG